MEEQVKELEILNETIEHMKKVQECMKDCDSVTTTEYHIFDLYLKELEDRAMKLEIDINGCILEEV